jgi:hypothetical protein
MSKEHNESSLPVWAQNLIVGLRSRNDILAKELNRTKEAHTVLKCNGWYTVGGPPPDAVFPRDIYYLWFLDRSGAHMACSLGKGDILLVGRKNSQQ